MTDQEPDVLTQVRDALDSGIVDGVKSSPETEEGAECTRSPDSSAIQSSEGYIDIEDYCKMLQEHRDDGIGPMDSRNLIGKQQSKLESQQIAHSVADLHNRIRSFDILKWSQKPDCISSFQCARFGWKLTEWGFLACVTCKNILPVPSQIPKLNGSEWAKRLRQQIELSGHLPTCPWVRMPSAEDMLSVPKGVDLYKYLCESVKSFKNMKTSPTLENHYKGVLVDLNLQWLHELMSACLPESALANLTNDKSDTVQDMVLFLVINGWTMSEVEDLMSCQLCLREVPLWLCQPTPQQEILDLLSPPASPILNKSFSCKEFNPVCNHWSWCPWRRRLLSLPDGTSTPGTLSKDSQDYGVQTKVQANNDVYEKLLEDFKKECDSITLNYDKRKSNFQLMGSVTSLFDDFVASSVPPLSESQESSETNGNAHTENSPPTNDNSSDIGRTELKASSDDQPDIAAPPKKRIRREFFETGPDV